jgi:PmbA protein
MTGTLEGSTRSSCFDSDGLALTEQRIVKDGDAVAYYGSNRYGQYLGEKPTGDLQCIRCDAGSVRKCDMPETYLEIISMSGLQVDFYTDYIGGEVRLAYYHDHGKITPVTGISVSGKLGDILNHIRLSADCDLQGSYFGPKQAILTGMNIF